MNTFRLILRDSSFLTIEFNSLREGFKLPLADALIEIRRKNGTAPVALEIAYKRPASSLKPKTAALRWVGLPEKLFFDGRLPSPVRWECAGDLHDHLVKAREEVLESLPGYRAPAPVSGV